MRLDGKLEYKVTMSSKQSILRVVRIGNLGLFYIENKVLVYNRLGYLIDRHFGLRSRLPLKTRSHRGDEPVFEKRQLMAAYFIPIARHFGQSIATQLEFRVSIAPAVPFQDLLSKL